MWGQAHSGTLETCHRCLYWAFTPAPLPNVWSPTYLGPDPRLTLDLMLLSCRLTQDLSFFKKSGLLLDFIISEGTNRPITLFLKRSGTRVNVSKFPKLIVLTTHLGHFLKQH